MSFFPPIDHIHRRSSSFTHPQTYHEFMEYASQCRDELEVYSHMEENQIGINEIQFWITFLQTLKERCQFKLLIKKITQLKQMNPLREKSWFTSIVQFQLALIKELQLQVRRRKKTKRRSVRQFQLFSISKLLKKTRTIGDGSFEIYVDQENREKYKLNDLSEFVLDEMKDYVNIKIKKYEQKRANRPWSFLGEKEDGLKILSKELIEANKRNSQFVSISQLMNGRFSNQQRVTEKRLSMARKSNKLADNNPEIDKFKSPKFQNKQKMQFNSIETPIMKLMSSRKSQEGFRNVFTTPTMKNLTMPKNIMQANGKNRRKNPGEGSEQESEVSQLERELHGLNELTDFDKDLMEFPGYKELIRREDPNIVGSFTQQIFVDHNDGYEQNQQLNMGRLEMSGSEENQQLQSHLAVSTVLNCLKSTKTFESLDSNDENIFSNEKRLPHPEQQFINVRPIRAFRRTGRPLQVIPPSDLQQRQSPSRSNSEFSISQIQKVQTVSSEPLQYQLLLEDMDNEMRKVNLNQHQNLVYETMRKKKIQEIKESQKRRENSHPNGIHTEIKLPPRLAHISEEHSYHSERRYTSRSRLGSGIYKDDENEEK